jgi:hypothetical protein
MMILLLASESAASHALGKDIAGALDAEWTPQNALDKIAPDDKKARCRLCTAQTREQAKSLSEALTKRGRPPLLALSLDEFVNSPKRSGQSSQNPAQDYFAEQGLLRKLRTEAEHSAITATARRIFDDVLQAQQGSNQDAFSAALELAASARLASTPPTEVAETSPEPSLPAKRVEPSSQPAQKTASWKRAAAQKGRIKRQSPIAKGKPSGKR